MSSTKIPIEEMFASIVMVDSESSEQLQRVQDMLKKKKHTMQLKVVAETMRLLSKKMQS